MTRYKITFTDGACISICLDYEPQVGDSFPGNFLFPKTIDTVEEV